MRSATSSRIAFGLAVLTAVAFASAAAAQTVDWLAVPAPQDSQIVHDSVRHRLVLVHPDARSGKMIVWEWHADRWVRRASAAPPAARRAFGLAFDRANGRVLMFGGRSTVSAGALGDTWTWDGEQWLQHTPTTSPSARYSGAMVYHASSQRVLLFGGMTGPITLLSDTWEWNGSTWTQHSTAAAPILAGRMAYDASRDRCVLCGWSAGGFATWEWDGTNWQQMNPPTAPGQRSGHVVWYDPSRQRVGLFGGVFYPGHPGLPPLNYDDTWEWDGVAWTTLPTTVRPSARWGASAAWDPGAQRVLMQGGAFSAPFDTVPLHDTWHWDGASWSVAEAPTRPPSLWTALVGSGVTYDVARGRTVLVPRAVGFQSFETWERDAQRWQQRQPANSPPPRQLGALAYDRARARVVLFGGSGAASGPLADTWEWDGTNWSLRATPIFPRARQAHAMTYDAARQRVVLFGGVSSAGSLLADTWEWDGVAWQLASPVGPPGRDEHAMAYDVVRQRVVLCGGRANATAWLTDVWEWDGSSWVARSPHGGPAAQVAMVYDELRQVVVLRTAGEIREWDGVSWSPASPATPAPLGDGVLVYESALQRTLLDGSSTGAWVYGRVSLALAQSAGTGCSGSNGTPVLASPEPSLGHPAFALELLAALPGAPCAFWLSDAAQSVAIGPCSLLVGAPLLTSLAVTDGGGYASGIQVAIPLAGSLRGLTFHAQAFVLDPLGAVGGLAATQRRTLVLGD